jgi:hypothetical protein
MGMKGVGKGKTEMGGVEGLGMKGVGKGKTEMGGVEGLGVKGVGKGKTEMGGVEGLGMKGVGKGYPPYFQSCYGMGMKGVGKGKTEMGGVEGLGLWRYPPYFQEVTERAKEATERAKEATERAKWGRVKVERRYRTCGWYKSERYQRERYDYIIDSEDDFSFASMSFDDSLDDSSTSSDSDLDTLFFASNAALAYADRHTVVPQAVIKAH